MEYEPIDIGLTESQANRSIRARYLRNGVDYFSLRKLIYGNTEKTYESDDDGVVSMNLFGNDRYYHFVLPKSFDDGTKDYNTYTVNSFLDEIKTINSPSFNWCCEWFETIKATVNELFQALYMMVVDASDGAYTENYVLFPQITNVNLWTLMVEYLRLLFITNNPELLALPLSVFELEEGSGRYGFPLLTYAKKEDGTFAPQFELAIYITI